jgi:uncharacterized protein YcfJ
MWGKAMTGFVAAGLLLTGQTALADPYRGGRGRGYPARYDAPRAEYDWARVTDVEPLVRRVRVTTPRRECWTETRYERIEDRPGHRGAAGSMILGSIIGAAIGNQIGSGDGRRAATVAGAVIGGAIGHDRAENRNPRSYGYTERPYEVERCENDIEEHFEERIEGYRVSYVYNGREMTTELPYDPGDRIRVRVDVRPAERY